MTDIKRNKVPWRTAPQPPPSNTVRAAQELEKLSAGTEVAPLAPRKRPVLGQATAAAYRGNQLTGATLDARKDLPPFGYNPPPQKILEARRERLARTYARPIETPRHASAERLIARALEPRTRRAAILQHRLNTDSMVRSAFEKKTATRVVQDRRADGTITVQNPGAGVSTAVGAMSAAPVRNFYDLLAAMEAGVTAQANELSADMAKSARAKGNAASDVAPSFPLSAGVESSLTGFGDTSGPNGLADEDEDQEGTSSIARGLSADPTGLVQNVANVAMSSTSDSGSMDVKAQKVQLAIQRMSQMYSLISNMLSKYNQNAMASINNTK